MAKKVPAPKTPVQPAVPKASVKNESKTSTKTSIPVKVKAVESAVKAATPRPAPTANGFDWHQLLRWPYLAGAGVAIVIIIFGIALATVDNNDSLETATSDTSETVNVGVDLPFNPDIAGGNRNEHGHFYPVAVMIDNHNAARPQSGLQAASVVYEALVEGGITRFMAVYDQGEISQIGPVRSARPYYLEWLAEYEAAYAHAGGSPEALSTIRKDRVHDINAIGNAAKSFSRDRTRPAPHNLYTTSFALFLSTKANKLSYSDADISPWTFSTSLPAGGTAAKTVDMFFSGKAKSTQVTYAYNAERKMWLRSQAGVAHQDRLTKAQIGVTNLVVQRIPSKIGVGEKGRLSMTVTGTGTAQIFQQGTVRTVQWSKTDANARTVFTNTDGTPAVFLPGNTWVEVLPSDRTLTVQ